MDFSKHTEPMNPAYPTPALWDRHYPLLPFDLKSGNVLAYAPRWGFSGKDPTFEWRHVPAFTETMEVVDIERGQSAAKFILQDLEGFKWYCSMSNTLKLLRGSKIDHGVIEPRTWKAAKQGQNYFIAPA